MRNSLVSSSPPAFSCWVITRGLMLVIVGAVTTGCDSRPTTTKPTATTSDVAHVTKSPALPESATATDRESIIARSEELVGQQDYPAAAAELKKLLLVDPGDVEVLFRLAGIEANAGNLAGAVDLLDGIPLDHPEAGLAALGQSADWCFQLKRYEEAELRYRKVLELAPEAAPALRQLAYLLNRQGRRHEAARYVQKLCELGNVRQDELHGLIALSDAMYDDPAGSVNKLANENPYWPIGPWGEARKQFNDQQFTAAVESLQQSVADRTAPPAVVALYGRAAAEAQDSQSFQWWLAQTDDQTREFAEYWAALGTYLLSEGRFEEAARALAEAIDRDPTDLLSIGRLRQAFLVLQDDQAAQRLTDHWTSIRETLRANNRVAATNPPDPEAIAELASRLKGLNRPLEAVLWQAIELHYRAAPQSERLKLNQQRQQLVASGSMFPSRSQRLCGLELARYRLPKIDVIEQSESDIARPRDNSETPTPATFQNVAQQVGLNHTYAVASQPVDFGFAVYQMLGGGAVVLDYDLDGYCDLYFAQGGSDPPTFSAARSNQLYRHCDAAVFDVTAVAAAEERQYSIGMTAGDWNQDGFPDLVIANIGIDMLLINNGDGTFQRRPITNKINTNRIPSSVAIADLTGDGLPDILQASYVDDPRRVMKPPTDDSGQPLSPILPSKFRPGADVLVRNDGAGDFTINPLTPSAKADATSLGLIVTDFDGKPGNEIFVGNDLKPNQLWVRLASQGWSDVAPVRGCAFSFTGSATASMGVAAGDFQNNGTLDLHITNYQDENASLFLSERGMYQDRNVQQRIASASHAVLGFGTQSIDYDNDGRRDLVVTNGHIDDAVDNSAPFRQPPQLFANLGGRFELVDVSDSSKYWNDSHVGRGLARLDFDRDGKSDIVITHLEQPSALLLNQTSTDHHWLQLRLVGTSSERDSVGARIRVRCGQFESTDWVIAGDGYLSHNEELVCFGLGKATKIDQIIIDWPSGSGQVFKKIPADQRLLIIENEDEPYVLFAAP